MAQSDPVTLAYVFGKLWIALFAFFGWLWSRIYKNEASVQEVKDSLARHKTFLAENYTPKDDFKDFKKDMIKRFDRLEELLRNKL